MNQRKRQKNTDGEGTVCFRVNSYLMVYLFTDLPGQINVKPHGNNVVVTWNPEYSPKCFVVDWGTRKEDMRMKIVATAAGNFTLGKSNSHISCRHHFTYWLFLAGEGRIFILFLRANQGSS